MISSKSKKGNFIDTKCKKHSYQNSFFNKKGNFIDMFGLVELLVVIVFLGLFVIIVLGAVTTGFTSNPSIPPETTNGMIEVNLKYPMLIDMLFTGFLLAIFAFSIFAARLIPSSPKVIFVALVFLGGGALFGRLIEQIWYPFTQHSFLGPYVDLMSIAPFIMDHFTIVIIIFITSVSIALLAKEESVP